MAPQKWSDRRSLEDENVQPGLYLKLWLLRTQTRRSLRNLNLHSSVNTNWFQYSFPNCLLSLPHLNISCLVSALSISFLAAARGYVGQEDAESYNARPSCPVWSCWVRLAVSGCSEICLFALFSAQILHRVLTVFWELGFGKTIPLATKVFHMFLGVESFSDLAACKWLDRRTLLASAQ